MIQFFAAHFVSSRLASPPLALQVEWILDDAVGAEFGQLFNLEPDFTDVSFVMGDEAARTRKREFHAALAFFVQVAGLTSATLPDEWYFRGTAETGGFPELSPPENVDLTAVERQYWKRLRLERDSEQFVEDFFASHRDLSNDLAVHVHQTTWSSALKLNAGTELVHRWLLHQKDAELEASGSDRPGSLETLIFFSIDNEAQLNAFRDAYKSRMIRSTSEVVVSPYSLDQYSTSQERGLALTAYNIQQVRDAFIAKHAKAFIGSEAPGRSSISDGSMLFLRLWWAEHPDWTPCVSRSRMSEASFVDWQRHKPNTDCSQSFRRRIPSPGKAMWPLNGVPQGSIDAERRAYKSATEVAKNAAAAAAAAAAEDEEQQQEEEEEEEQEEEEEEQGDEYSRAGGSVVRPQERLEQQAASPARRAMDQPPADAFSRSLNALGRMASSDDWRVVPPLGFSIDGPAAPASKFWDDGLQGEERPNVKHQWEGAISAKFADIVDPMAYINPVDTLDRIKSRAIDGTLILLVSGISYREILLNFIWILEKRFQLYNYGIACMDQEMCIWLEKMGKRDMSYRMVEGRLELAYQLLRDGIDLIMTDTDAVWIKNPIPSLQIADITAQRDRHPKSLYQEWGSTFCTGLLGIKSKPMTVKFLSAFVAMINHKIKFLDQRTFNQALNRGGIDWFGKHLVHDYGGSKLVDRGILRNFDNTTVALLPQDPFRRLCSEKEGAKMQVKAAVIHCTGAKKIGNSKADALRTFHLYVLPEDWEHRMEPAETYPLRMFDLRPWTDPVELIRSNQYKTNRRPRQPQQQPQPQQQQQPAAVQEEPPVESAREPQAAAGGPQGFRAEGSAGAQDAASDPRQDPSMWRAVMSNEHGRLYWYNLVTRETSWTKPEVVP